MDKAEIARRQLGMALALFLDDRDAVSVHCLACGGGEVAEHLATKAEAVPFAELNSAEPGWDKTVRKIRAQYWNAFKHATTRKGLDRQDEELLASFSDEINDHALFLGWYDFTLAADGLPMEAQVFQLWYFGMHAAEMNLEAARPDTYVRVQKMFGSDLTTVPRAEAKHRLRVIIEQAKQDGEMMSDPRTENRALDLGV